MVGVCVMLSTDPLLVKSQFQLVKVPPFALDKSVKVVDVPKQTFKKVKFGVGNGCTVII